MREFELIFFFFFGCRESAGAMSVSVQLSLASSAGLFHKAILESGIAEGYPSLQVRYIPDYTFILC